MPDNKPSTPTWAKVVGIIVLLVFVFGIVAPIIVKLWDFALS